MRMCCAIFTYWHHKKKQTVIAISQQCCSENWNTCMPEPLSCICIIFRPPSLTVTCIEVDWASKLPTTQIVSKRSASVFQKLPFHNIWPPNRNSFFTRKGCLKYIYLSIRFVQNNKITIWLLILRWPAYKVVLMKVLL